MTTNDIQRTLGALRAVTIALLIAAGAGLLGCKSKPPKPPPPPPPVILTLSLSASADVNPDSQSRPSPVVVRLYQLKDDAAFKDADIYALFDKEQATLGGSLALREEYELAPSEHRSLTIKPPPDVRFIGVVAAYRDIRNAQWRAQLGVPDKSKTIVVNVAHTSVSLSMY
jgi:type VI secretion system protein VasD